MPIAHRYTLPDGDYYASFDDKGFTPGNSTYVEPEFIPGFHPRWPVNDPDATAWIQVEDHRGKEGYIGSTPHTIKELGPLPAGWSVFPEYSESEDDAAARVYVLGQLAALDAKYLTPRTIAGLATGDPYALEQYRLHEEEAEPWRARLAAIPVPEGGDA